jgi:hypothetical protein
MYTQVFLSIWNYFLCYNSYNPSIGLHSSSMAYVNNWCKLHPRHQLSANYHSSNSANAKALCWIVKNIPGLIFYVSKVSGSNNLIGMKVTDCTIVYDLSLRRLKPVDRLSDYFFGA